MQIFNLDISQKGIPPVLLVKQIDVGRKFKVIITDGGAAYTVPEDAVFSVWYAGSSGSGNYSTIDDRPAVVVDGNVATVEIIAQMITNSGGGNLCLVLNAVDGSQIGLWNITYIVEAVPGMGSKAAEEYYTAFSKAASDLALAAKTFTPDKTLTKPDSPAEAAATGQAIAVERARINELAAMRGENGELTFSYDEGGVIFSIISNGAYAIISGKLSNFSKQAGEVKVKIPNTFKPFNGDVLLYDEHITISVVAEEAEPYDAYFRIYSASQISVNEICFSEEYHTKDAYIPELADLRVGFDGATYSSAGEAVRQQFSKQGESISDVVSAMHSIVNHVAYDVEWTNGNIGTDGTEVDNEQRVRSNYIPIGSGVRIETYSKNSRLYWVHVYDAAQTHLGYAIPDDDGNMQAETNYTQKTSNIDTVINAYPSAAYVRFVVRTYSNNTVISPDTAYVNVTKSELYIPPLDSRYVIKEIAPYSDTDIMIQYDVAGGYYTRGFVKLPPNYTVDGKPVPLVVFVHPSNKYGEIHSSGVDMHGTYVDFVRDSGYAVFDCYAYSSKYSNIQGGSKSNTWGLPINNSCYSAGIDYVLNHFNVDRNNIFVAAKSLGGIQALSMLFSPNFPIKAGGLHSPEINPLNMQLGYSKQQKAVAADDLGFDADEMNVLDFNQGETIPDGFWDYITNNMPKWIGYNPSFVGLPIPNEQRYQYYNKIKNTGGMCRVSINRPLKVWHAADDQAVDYLQSKALIESLQNSGYTAELRTMPDETGGHGSVDTSDLALVETDYTTRCGVTWDKVPLAYVELVEYFDKMQ